jgi:hypothetical protein
MYAPDHRLQTGTFKSLPVFKTSPMANRMVAVSDSSALAGAGTVTDESYGEQLRDVSGTPVAEAKGKDVLEEWLESEPWRDKGRDYNTLNANHTVIDEKAVARSTLNSDQLLVQFNELSKGRRSNDHCRFPCRDFRRLDPASQSIDFTSIRIVSQHWEAQWTLDDVGQIQKRKKGTGYIPEEEDERSDGDESAWQASPSAGRRCW